MPQSLADAHCSSAVQYNAAKTGERAVSALALANGPTPSPPMINQLVMDRKPIPK